MIREAFHLPSNGGHFPTGQLEDELAALLRAELLRSPATVVSESEDRGHMVAVVYSWIALTLGMLALSLSLQFVLAAYACGRMAMGEG